MTQPAVSKQRVLSIDVLRGIVLVIMALDHVRDYVHITAMTQDPTDLSTTTPALFFTRWITHFCAPVFVFLAGTSGFLQSLRKPKKQLSGFLISRGLWLVIAEVTIITFGWTFDPGYHLFVFQVIWAIGMSMIILGLLVWLPFPVILFYGAAIVFLHNLLDFGEAGFFARKEPVPAWWQFLHGGPYFYPSFEAPVKAFVPYNFMVWSGVMAVGYCFGRLYSPSFPEERRRRILLGLGISVTALFIVLRAIDRYGDAAHWSSQPRGAMYTLLSFLNTTKYPPSLQYLCMTLGPAIIFLSVFERIRGAFARFFLTYGRVPFFYYILHIYLVHLACVVLFFIQGFGKENIRPNGFPPFMFRPVELGVNLPITYLIWIMVVLALYPLCKRYGKFKSRSQKKWTSYL